MDGEYDPRTNGDTLDLSTKLSRGNTDIGVNTPDLVSSTMETSPAGQDKFQLADVQNSDDDSWCDEDEDEGNPFIETVNHHEKENADMLCGLFSWRPACLKPLANMYVFVTLVGLSYFFSGMAGKSLFSQLVSIERQFNIDSGKSGLFNSAWHVGFACSVLFVGQWARHIHIPVAIGTSGVINGLLVMAPSFLELYAPYRLPQLDKSYATSASHGVPVEVDSNYQYLCRSPYNNHNFSTSIMDNITDDNNTTTFQNTYDIYSNASNLADDVEYDERNTGSIRDAHNEVAYYVLLISMFLQGFTGSFRYGALPFVYVDDNVLDKTKTGIFLAISFVFAEFTGPLGDLVNGYLSTIPVDLSDTAMSSEDPRFVSAWWLSFLVFGALSVLSAMPIVLLPRRLVSKEVQQSSLAYAMVTFAGGQDPAKYDSQEGLRSDNQPTLCKKGSKQYCQIPTHEPNTQDQEKTTKSPKSEPFTNTAFSQTSNMTLLDTIRDFPQAIIRLLRNPLYALLVTEIAIIYVPLAGVGPFYVKYIMFEYNTSASTTNLAKGLSSAITHIIGTSLGSLLTTRIHKRVGYLYLILITSFLTWTITPLIFVFGCDNKEVVGLSGYLGDNTGNHHSNPSCICDTSQNLLSCGSDGSTYLSPCFAGCEVTNGTLFSACTGLAEGNHSYTTVQGVCDPGCFTNFILFNVVAATRTFIFSINNMPRHLMSFRMVAVKDRAVSNAFLHFAGFMVSFPAPLFFGKWIESMCVVWTSDHCSLYDRDSIRNLIGGVEMLVVSLTVLTYGVMIFICRWMDKKVLDSATLQEEHTLVMGKDNSGFTKDDEVSTNCDQI